ncbi:MAG: aldose epimerase family protein [Spirochaetaceae bacterium]
MPLQGGQRRDYQGENTLHGGAVGFHRKLWTSELFGESEEAGVVFSRTSPHKECGFPGNLAVSIRLSLSEENELVLTYEATTDRPTAVNLTNHAYWNLAGRPQDTILGHVVTLDPDHYLPTGEGQIPTGRIAPVAGDPHDFRQPRPVGTDIGAVEDPESGRTMEIRSTMPGMQFYTGNKLEGAPARDGGTLVKHAGMCFETQFLPNAVNEPGFPSPFLYPGETYRHTTVHTFGTL